MFKSGRGTIASRAVIWVSYPGSPPPMEVVLSAVSPVPGEGPRVVSWVVQVYQAVSVWVWQVAGVGRRDP